MPGDRPINTWLPQVVPGASPGPGLVAHRTLKHNQRDPLGIYTRESLRHSAWNFRRWKNTLARTARDIDQPLLFIVLFTPATWGSVPASTLHLQLGHARQSFIALPTPAA